MRQRFLTKFITAWHILKHFVVDDISRVILKLYINLLIKNEIWYKICVWFSEIKWFGLDSPYTFSFSHTKFNSLKMSNPILVLTPNFGLNIRQSEDIYDILKFKQGGILRLQIAIHMHKTGKFIFRLLVIDNRCSLAFTDQSMIYDTNKLKEVVNYLKIKN